MKKTPKITVLIGCPASGKSTYAEWIVRTEPKTMRVSRDEIRFSQFQETVDPIVENMISKIIYQQVKTLVGNGWNVIIDNCHTKLEYINQHISDYNKLADIDFKLFDLPMETLQERNAKRSRKVPVNVIKNMFKNLQYVKEHFDFQTIKKVEKKLEYTSQNPDLQKAIIRKSFTTNNGTVYFTHKGLNINVFHSAKILTDERMFRIWSEFKISVFNEQEIEKYNDNVFMLTCYILKRKEECL